jgi:ATP-dependent 26S proteasome regulatory subunit
MQASLRPRVRVRRPERVASSPTLIARVPRVRDDTQELALLIESRFPIIVVETPEEPRFVALVEKACNLREQALFVWSVAQGLARANRLDRPEHAAATNELQDALRHIAQTPQNGVFVFLDAQPWLDNPIVVRLFREVAMAYAQTARTMILVGSRVALPSDLLRMSATFRMTLPTVDQIRELLREEIALWRSAHEGEALRGDAEAANMLVQHLVGFTRDDARRLIRQAIEHDATIDMVDVARVLRHKHESLASGGVLTLETGRDVVKFSDVGGQARLKRWLGLRQGAFCGSAGTERLAIPKGVLLLGVQGGGKSLAAKSIAGSWQVPLLRLDFGALYDKFSGETERNLRESLATAAAMAPCVLWLDEIEKGLATGDDATDGGVSRRVLGAFLTWMSERSARVFIVATANDISRLPAELLRKGRFDEIFFVDLPAEAVRREIFAIHLARRGSDVKAFDLDGLVAAAKGFSGAEIEQAIVATQYEAHATGRSLDGAMLLDELHGTRPLSVVRAEEIDALREWAAERTVAVD